MGVWADKSIFVMKIKSGAIGHLISGWARVASNTESLVMNELTCWMVDEFSASVPLAAGNQRVVWVWVWQQRLQFLRLEVQATKRRHLPCDPASAP